MAVSLPYLSLKPLLPLHNSLKLERIQRSSISPVQQSDSAGKRTCPPLRGSCCCRWHFQTSPKTPAIPVFCRLIFYTSNLGSFAVVLGVDELADE